jgi:hypothetical protein
MTYVLNTRIGSRHLLGGTLKIVVNAFMCTALAASLGNYLGSDVVTSIAS